MIRARARVPGLILMGAVAVLAGCEAPTSPVSDAAVSGGVVTASAKKTPVEPLVDPVCTGAGPSVCAVVVNVKHGNDQGKINLKGVRNGQAGSQGNGASLTVSVLGSSEFDLSAVDLGTLLLGDPALSGSGTPLNVRDGGEQASIVDLDGDGILDLLLHFSLPDMVANDDLAESTVELCLYGEGPDYVLDGCGGVGVSGGGGDGGGKVTYSAVELISYGRDAPFPAMVRVIGGAADPFLVQAGWTTAELGSLVFPWLPKSISIGSDINNGNTLNGQCGLYPDSWYWLAHHQLMARLDLGTDAAPLAAGTTNVAIEFMVDDEARFFVNGVEITNGFKRSRQSGCARYDTTVILRVPDSVLSPDGKNKIAVLAADGGSATYLDFRVTADVPNP